MSWAARAAKKGPLSSSGPTKEGVKHTSLSLTSASTSSTSSGSVVSSSSPSSSSSSSSSHPSQKQAAHNTLHYMLSNLRGHIVTVQDKFGHSYEGVFHTAEFDSGSPITIVLKQAQLTVKSGERNTHPYADTYRIHSSDLVSMRAKPINLLHNTQGYAGASSLSSSSSAHSKNAFATDSQISNRDRSERELERWDAGTHHGSGAYVGLEDSGSGGKWDQFQTFEKMTNKTSTFNFDDYSTPLDRNSEHYKAQVAKAEKLAREIEGESSNNIHMAQERGQDITRFLKSGINEEDLYSTVQEDRDVRDKVNGTGPSQGQGASSSPASPTSSANASLSSSGSKYVIPSRRSGIQVSDANGTDTKRAPNAKSRDKKDKSGKDGANAGDTEDDDNLGPEHDESSTEVGGPGDLEESKENAKEKANGRKEIAKDNKNLADDSANQSDSGAHAAVTSTAGNATDNAHLPEESKSVLEVDSAKSSVSAGEHGAAGDKKDDEPKENKKDKPAKPLNPFAKSFVFNPNAKEFVPSVSSSSSSPGTKSISGHHSPPLMPTSLPHPGLYNAMGQIHPIPGNPNFVGGQIPAVGFPMHPHQSRPGGGNSRGQIRNGQHHQNHQGLQQQQQPSPPQGFISPQNFIPTAGYPGLAMNASNLQQAFIPGGPSSYAIPGMPPMPVNVNPGQRPPMQGVAPAFDPRIPHIYMNAPVPFPMNAAPMPNMQQQRMPNMPMQQQQQRGSRSFDAQPL